MLSRSSRLKSPGTPWWIVRSGLTWGRDGWDLSYEDGRNTNLLDPRDMISNLIYDKTYSGITYLDQRYNPRVIWSCDELPFSMLTFLSQLRRYRRDISTTNNRIGELSI